MNDSYDTLLARIREEFSNVPKPHITLRLAKVLDDHWGLPEPEAGLAREKDSYYNHWWEVSPDELTHDGIFWNLMDISFIYQLS